VHRAFPPLLALLLTGCPPSMGEVVDQNAPALSARHAALKEVVASLPAPGSLSAPSPAAGLTPAPIYDEVQDTFTLELLQAEYVSDPLLDLKPAGKLDLYLGEVLKDALSSVAGGLKPEHRSQASNDHFRGKFEKALAVRYVGLVRTVEYAAPVATSEKEFTGGHAKLEVFVVDLQDRSVKASFPVEARSSTRVSYEYKQGEDPRERLQAFAHSTMWSSARDQIADGLRKHAGATIAYD
jgi:hypothetical protein